MTVNHDDFYAKKGNGHDYESNNFWAIRHMGEARNYFADYWGDYARENLKRATETEDCLEASDLVMVMPVRETKLRLALRVRREGYEFFKGKDITIRSRLASGIDTELQKFIQGWGDYFMYCHGDTNNLTAYSIIYLHGWRMWRLKYIELYRQEPGTEQPNPDGKTSFRYYEIAKFPKSVLVRHVADIKPPKTVRIIEPAIPRIAGHQTNLFEK